MKFNKYPSLTNAYKQEFIFKAMETVPDDILWYVTEKVHGANFQIMMYGDEVAVASRNGISDLSFFNLEHSEEFMIEYERCIYLLSHLREIYGKVNISIFGEVYGGKIQKGIFYSDAKRFRVFDITIDGIFLDRNDCLEYYDKFNIEYCTTIIQGTLQECLEHSNQFDSLIDAELTQEEVREGNTCEGIVIRPVIPYYTSKGEFIAIKNKNDKWVEKSRLPKVSKQDITLPNEYMKIYTVMDQYITLNTVNSAISKIGREMKFIPELMKELNTDIIKSVMDDYPSVFELKDCKLVYKRFNKRLITMVKEQIQNYQV